MAKSGAAGFSADVARIAAAVAPFATAPDWLKYTEDMAGKSLPNKILPHKEMWIAIAAVHETLAFTPKQAETIMLCVARNHSSLWTRELNDEELKDFRQRMGKRLRKMARDIRQALVKKTGWALKLMNKDDAPLAGEVVDDTAELENEEQEETEDGHAEDEDEEEENEEMEEEEAEEDEVSPTVAKRPAAAEAAAISQPVAKKRPAAASIDQESEFFYGFDWELSSAWREAAAGGARAYAVARVSQDGPDGHPVAMFDKIQGDVEIKALTNAELKDKLSTALYRKGNLWESDLPSGGRLRVARHSAPSLLQPFFKLMLHLRGGPTVLQSNPA